MVIWGVSTSRVQEISFEIMGCYSGFKNECYPHNLNLSLRLLKHIKRKV